MKAWVKILISSISNGVIAFGGAITAVFVEVGSGGLFNWRELDESSTKTRRFNKSHQVS